MRLRGWMVLGALGMGAVGCGDVAGPTIAAARDLEFHAPDPFGRREAASVRAWDDPISEVERARLEAAVARDAEGVILPPLILSSYLSGEWNRNELWIQYGFFGAGSGYAMTPRAEFRDASGALVGERAGFGRREEQGVYWYMHPAGEELMLAGRDCGLHAGVNVQFEVRSVGTILGERVTLRNVSSAQRVIAQTMCPVSSGGVGRVEIPTSDGTTLWLCQYEVWTDIDGDVIDVFFFGCTQVTGQLYAE